MESLDEQLIRHEDLRFKPYTCPAGKTTIGVGRNLDDKGITREEAMALLENDIADARADVDVILDQYKIAKWGFNQARLDALTNMAFNIGRRRLACFKKMFAAIKVGDYEAAASEMLDSKYAQDVGQRAVELAEQLRTGKRRGE